MRSIPASAVHASMAAVCDRPAVTAVNAALVTTDQSVRCLITAATMAAPAVAPHVAATITVGFTCICGRVVPMDSYTSIMMSMALVMCALIFHMEASMKIPAGRHAECLGTGAFLA